MSQQTGRPQPDPAPRGRATIAAVIGALLLLLAMVWLVQTFVEQQRIERCLANRRPDCVQIPSPAREAPVDLKR